jgi:tellurite resistance protein TehA-like permease
MVFPLGMYAVCTFRLSEALEITFLKVIPEFFIYAAIFAWIAVIVGFVRHWAMLFRNQTKRSISKGMG